MSAITFKARGTRGEIWLYGPVGDTWGEGMSAKQFAGELSGLGKVDHIALHINSEGGSVFDGIAIYNQLAHHPAQIEVSIDGLAASIASVIAMAGDSIAMADNAMLMIHDPYGAAFGDSTEMRRTAELLDQVKGSILTTYAKRTGLKPDELSDMMTAETWMDADVAKRHGFVDHVTGALPLAACASVDWSRFKRAPEKLKARAVSPEQAVSVVQMTEMAKRMRAHCAQ